MCPLLQIIYEKITLHSVSSEDATLDFLEWIQNNRNCCPRTMNHRYTAMRSFFKYMLYIDSVHLSQWKTLSSLKPVKEKRNTMKYLTINSVKYLFDQVNVEARKGRRDLTMLSLLYNRGARVQELIDLTVSSIRKVSLII